MVRGLLDVLYFFGLSENRFHFNGHSQFKTISIINNPAFLRSGDHLFYFAVSNLGQLGSLPQLELNSPADDDGKEKTKQPKDPKQTKMDPFEFRFIHFRISICPFSGDLNPNCVKAIPSILSGDFISATWIRSFLLISINAPFCFCALAIS